MNCEKFSDSPEASAYGQGDLTASAKHAWVNGRSA